MAPYLPPVGFHFKVEVFGLSPTIDHDVRFTEVGGLSVELVTEELPEGGENRYVQKYPARAKYPELTLKRGLLRPSGITQWISQCVEGIAIEPKDLDVTLLNEEHEPLLTWHVVKAWPTRWSVSDLNASSNTIVVESVQLYYQYFTLDGAE